MRQPIHPFNGPQDTSGTSAVEYFCDKCNARIEGSVVNQGGKHFHVYCARTPEQLKDDRIAGLEAQLADCRAALSAMANDRDECKRAASQALDEAHEARTKLAEAKAEVERRATDFRIAREQVVVIRADRDAVLGQRDAIAQRLAKWRDCAGSLYARVAYHAPVCERSLDRLKPDRMADRNAIAAFERLQKEES